MADRLASVLEATVAPINSVKYTDRKSKNMPIAFVSRWLMYHIKEQHGGRAISS
jgi:hypothetical protein